MNEPTVIPTPAFEFTLQRRSDVATLVAEVLRNGLLRSFSTEERGIVGTVVSELASNIVKYAGEGLIRMQLLEKNGLPGVRIEAIDRGPSIPDIRKAMEDGFSTGGTLGLGLPAVRRLTDWMEISIPEGGGTHVSVVRWCRWPETAQSNAMVAPPATPQTKITDPKSKRPASDQPLMLSIRTWERPKPPLKVSGDRVWSTQADRYALLVHLDALGHGIRADSAASRILEFIQKQIGTWPTDPTTDHLLELLEASHRAAMGTVGASIALVLIDRHRRTLHHLGVGNISLLQFNRSGNEGISRPGAIGQHYRRPQIGSFSIDHSDRFITFSDGLSCSAVRRIRDVLKSQTDESTLIEQIIGAAKVSDDSSFMVVTCSNP